MWNEIVSLFARLDDFVELKGDSQVFSYLNQGDVINRNKTGFYLVEIFYYIILLQCLTSSLNAFLKIFILFNSTINYF